ncbi:MAG: peptidylprolyl isomerase [Pseudomonadota bacterium]
MKKPILCAAAALAIALFSAGPFALPVAAQEPPEEAPSPTAIVNAAPAEEWIVIPAEDLLVMTLAPDAAGRERRVTLQLMPAPFSQGWVENIRILARAEWYDGISVNRVQDNYVVQWGDPGYDNPESGETEQKPLPEGLNVMTEADYPATGVLSSADSRFNDPLAARMIRNSIVASNGVGALPADFVETLENGGTPAIQPPELGDRYGGIATHMLGWPLTGTIGRLSLGTANKFWPVHCYGMVGVGRNFSPDTGTGAELYTVIGHAPRHLDRNIALVGRIISGMEHLSSLPRGSGTLGFYTEEEADLRTPILSIRVAADLPEDAQPLFEYLSTESETFARYAEARANRRDPFFIVPAGGADICNIPVPIRAFEYAEDEAE